MDMNWDAIGAIGEIVGALAVVMTLIYLAVQIKQNSRVSRSVAIQGWATTSALEKSVIFTDPEFAAFLLKGSSDYDQLDPTEKLRYRNYAIQVINSFELLYFQWQNGTIDKTYFLGKEESYLHSIQQKGFRRVWEQSATQQWDPRFIKYVNERVERDDA